MYLAKTPTLLQALMPAYMWRVPTRAKMLYLTFDDGPIPEVTPWVLDTLAQYDAKATFFCVGANVERHAALFQRIKKEGHAVGNHTYNHVNGWETDNAEYFQNIRKCARLVDSVLFRPPYGRISPAQRMFIDRHYQIVMWDVLSGDFDNTITPQQCLDNVVDNARGGSIIVMHDSIKAEERLRFALPRILAHFSELGYSFEALGRVRAPSLIGTRTLRSMPERQTVAV
jgi:peptidoglycan-N-acetylglucosamine deacetylase